MKPIAPEMLEIKKIELSVLKFVSLTPEFVLKFAGLSIAALLISHIYFCYFSNTARKLRKLSGPFYIPILGSSLVLRKDLIDVFNPTRRLFPKGTSRFWVGFRAVVTTSDCDVIQKVLTSSTSLNKSQDFVHAAQKTITKNSILISDRGKWKLQRKTLVPGLNTNMHDDFLQVFHTHLDYLMKLLDEECGKGKEVLMDDMFGKFAMGVGFETLLDWDQSINAFQDDLPGFYEALARGTKLIFIPALQPLLSYSIFWRLSGLEKEFVQIKQLLQKYWSTEYLTDKMKEWKAYAMTGAMPHRMKYVNILYSKWEDPDEVFFQIITALTASMDSTEAVLCLTLLYIAKYPDVQKKVYDEARQVITDVDSPMTVENVNNLKYTEMVLKETMRIIPPTPALGRQVCEDMDLGNGVIIPKDTTVFCNIGMVHSNPDYYPNPEDFIPERFLPENMEKRHPYSYLPFSGGPRNCIGQKYAMFEMKFVIAKIIRKYEISTTMDDPAKLKFEYFPFAKIKGGLRLGFKRRKEIGYCNNKSFDD